MNTEIVYVCSPDFWRYLFLSLRTLLTSGTEFDCVRIYVVADEHPGWTFDDSRIVVETVRDIGANGSWGHYWGNNKAHLCRSKAERVVYLDTDTMVLRPLGLVGKGTDADLIARYAVVTYMDGWHDEKRWKQALDTFGAADYPLLSPGFMIFQNGAHSKIETVWHEVIYGILEGRSSLPVNKHAELFAFSIAASMVELSHEPMKKSDHRYAMIGESSDDAVVYHLGTPGFYRHYLPLEKKLGLHKCSTLPVPRPRFTSIHDVYTRVQHRLKTMALGKRDHRLEY